MTEKNRLLRIQAMLFLLGFDDDGKLIVNGEDTNSSKAAIAAYQTDRGLSITGELDNDMWNYVRTHERIDGMPKGAGLMQHQCVLILCGCVSDDFVANGEWDQPTQAGFLSLVVGVMERHYIQLDGRLEGGE